MAAPLPPEAPTALARNESAAGVKPLSTMINALMTAVSAHRSTGETALIWFSARRPRHTPSMATSDVRSAAPRLTRGSTRLQTSRPVPKISA